jgi:hypothetical protein
MTTKEFYKRLSTDLYDNTHPNYQHLVKDLKITSLEQVLGVFRSIMIRNNASVDEAIKMKKDLKGLMDVLGLTEKDL